MSNKKAIHNYIFKGILGGKMKKLFKFFTSRLFVFGITILVQILALVFMVLYLANYGLYAYALFSILSIITLLFIVARNDNPIYKLAWTIPIAVMPVLGWLFYYLSGKGKKSKRKLRKVKKIFHSLEEISIQDNDVIAELSEEKTSIINHVAYIKNTSLFPVHTNTQTQYLSPGENFFEKLCTELEKAEVFIFMEYFIIEEGIMWNRILDILAKKASKGVEIKLIYDDIGCINTLPKNYRKKLEKLGIEVNVFNAIKPSIDVFMNYRDHRKITVIDGNVGFVGGNNLADEYINEKKRFGHWKDSSIMLSGDAVWNLSVMFLQMWQYDYDKKINYQKYKPTKTATKDGYVQPFCDGPLDNYLIGEMAYINIISRAKKYVTITTPYLILDNEMLTTLCGTALSGVKVTIITPHIADKWYVHLVTRYNYKRLIESGVEIYEYTNGFIHAKTIVADDIYGIVGTQNFDFRSFYLHYECGVFLYKTSSIAQVRKDHIDTIEMSQQITLDDCNNTNWFIKLLQIVLNLFAPLM